MLGSNIDHSGENQEPNKILLIWLLKLATIGIYSLSIDNTISNEPSCSHPHKSYGRDAGNSSSN